MKRVYFLMAMGLITTLSMTWWWQNLRSCGMDDSRWVS